MAETRTYQGHTYQRNAPGEAWSLVGSAPTGGVLASPPKLPDPYQVQKDREAAAARARDDRRADDSAAITAARARRDEIEWKATHNPDGTKKEPADAAGKPLPAWAATPYEKQVGIFGEIAGGLNQFKDEYAGNTLTGGLENTLQAKGLDFGMASPGQRDWWARFGSTDNVIRNDLFGASLTDGEKASYAATTVDPSMDPKIVKENLGRRREILAKALARKTNFLKAQGYSREAIEALAGEYAQEFGAAVVAPVEPPGSGDDRPNGLTPDQQAAYDAFNRINPNATAEQLNAFAKSIGMESIANADDIVRKRDAGGGLPSAVGASVNPQDTPPDNGGGLMRSLHMGVGDVAQGAGDVLGLVANPVNAGINAVLGTNLGTDLGQTFRNAVGAPEPQSRQEQIVSAINRGGTGAMGFGGIASLARGAGGMAAPVVNSLLASPVADVVGGMGAGGGAEYARQGGAGPVGQLAGGLVGGLTGAGGANALRRLASGPVERAPNALLQAADRQNVTMMPADVGSRGTRMAAGVAGRTLGGIPMAEGSQVALRSAKGARDRVAANVGEVLDETGAGQAAQRGAKRWMETSNARAEQLFERISVPGDMGAVSDSTRSTLADTIKGFTSNPKLSAIWTGHPRLRRTLEALTPVDVSAEGRREFAAANEALQAAQGRHQMLLNSVSDPRAVAAARDDMARAQQAVEVAAEKANRPPEGGKISWEDMKRLRSIVGEIVGSPSLSSDGNATAALRRFYGALTSDMEATAQQAGPKALSEFRRANQYWRGRQGRVEDVVTSLLGNDGSKGEAKAFEQINNWAQNKGGDFKRLAQAVRSMPQEEADTVRASLIGRMGNAKPGKANADNLEFSPAEWATSWRSLSPRAKAVLFPNQRHRQDLNDLSTVFDNMKMAGEYANFSNTSLGGNAAATILSALGGGLPGAAAAAGYSGLSLGAGKLLASPRFARWLASAPKSANPQARASHIKQLTSIAARNPSIAEDVQALQQQLMNVANDNVSAVAAGGNQQQDRNQR